MSTESPSTTSAAISAVCLDPSGISAGGPSQFSRVTPSHWVACGRRTTSLPSPPPYPLFQALPKSTIVHIASSQMGSGCPSVEVEVDVPATEKCRGGRELETGQAAEWLSLRISEGFLIRPCILSRRGSMYAQWKLPEASSIPWPTAQSVRSKHATFLLFRGGSTRLSSFASTLSGYGVAGRCPKATAPASLPRRGHGCRTGAQSRTPAKGLAPSQKTKP
jgi:hypothetical protein